MTIPVHPDVAQNGIYFQQANSFTKDKDSLLWKILLRIVSQDLIATLQD